MMKLVVYGEAALHIVAQIPEQFTDMPAMLFDGVAFTIGGSAGTVCWQLAELGYPPYFAGVVGDDWVGAYVTQELVRRGVDCSGIRRIGNSTTRVLVLVQPCGGHKLVVEPGSGWVPQMSGERSLYTEANLLTYVPGFPGYESTIMQLHADGARLIADLGFMTLLSDYPAMRKHAMMLAPYLDIMILSGEHGDEEHNQSLAHACLEAGVRVVVTTLSAYGALLNTCDVSVHLPAYPVSARNTLCAGDAFVAGFLVAQIEGCSLYESVQFGQAVAAVKVTQLSALPTRHDVEAFLQEKR
jgi:sugar/nucleoside kinase (ribokinase family)